MQPREFVHAQVVPYFMDRKLIAQRCADRGIAPDKTVEELTKEWLEA